MYRLTSISGSQKLHVQWLSLFRAYELAATTDLAYRGLKTGHYDAILGLLSKQQILRRQYKYIGI